MANSVMVFVEQFEGNIANVSLELISKGRELADRLGVQLEGVVVGYDMGEELAALGHFGCDRVYYINNKSLELFQSLPYTDAVSLVIKKYKPQIVLFGATTTGRDIAPRIASELRCGLTADCTDLQIGEFTLKGETYKDKLMQIRPAFGGNIIATIVSPDSSPSMATVRSGVMKMATPDPNRKGEIVEEAYTLKEETFLSEILEIIKIEKSVDLTSARIIVSAGMGAANPESMKLIAELASILGGEVAASRPMVDSGLLKKDHQVGQTGTTVRPNLYIACGISGQIQHRAGMNEAKRIIAINNDPEAPIFSIAHYGIVGDINDVLTKMIAAYKNKV